MDKFIYLIALVFCASCSSPVQPANTDGSWQMVNAGVEWLLTLHGDSIYSKYRIPGNPWGYLKGDMRMQIAYSDSAMLHAPCTTFTSFTAHKVGEYLQLRTVDSVYAFISAPKW